MAQQQMVELTKQEDGTLRIDLLPEGLRYLRDEAKAGDSELTKLGELLEYHTCNGWDWINPEVTDVGLTSNYLILTDDAAMDDEQQITNNPDLYYYDDYMIRAATEELLREGHITLNVQRGESE